MKHFAFMFFTLMAAFALAGCGGSGNNSNSNVSVVAHTAPLGMWGGTMVSDAARTATLTLTATGGHFSFDCDFPADMTQPVQPDSSGHFSVPGTSQLIPAAIQNPTMFSGTVTNRVMTVTLRVTPVSGTPYTQGPYTVTFGQPAPIYQGGCPG